MDTIEVEGIAIEVHRKPIKNIYLRIYPPTGIVKLTAPHKQNSAFIYSFVQQKLSWIQAQKRLMVRLPIKKPLQGLPGESYKFLGKEYFLESIRSLRMKENFNMTRETELLQFPKNTINLYENRLLCNFAENASVTLKKKIILSWYKSQLQTIISTLLPVWEKRLNVTVKQWGIKQMRTRWGSCNPRLGRIWLNSCLMQKSQACIELVLVHELVHLLEPSHNKRFYAFMDKYLPGWRHIDKELKQIEWLDFPKDHHV